MIDIPKKITINFNGFEHEIVQKQVQSIDKNQLLFDTEFIFSNDIQNKMYVSFSQMINEAINRSKNEFIIFINPKVKIKSSELNDIIIKLCDGYCFVSKIGLAFFGITKELIRNIGLLDENLIGGNYEDDDLFIRLKIFGKKIYWGHNFENYNLYHSYNNINRGSSHSYFVKKWNYKNNEIFLKKDRDEKRLLDYERKDYIRKSWKTFDESYLEGHLVSKYDKVKINDFDNKTVIKNSNFKVNFDLNENYFYVLLESESNIMGISVMLTTTHDRGRIPVCNPFLYNNTWYRYDLSDYDDYSFEIRIYLDGNSIYVNTIKKGCIANIDFELPTINFK